MSLVSVWYNDGANTGEENTKDLLRSGIHKLWGIENMRRDLEENPQKCTRSLSQDLGG